MAFGAPFRVYKHFINYSDQPKKAHFFKKKSFENVVVIVYI
jgi:hypothetical protein